MFPYTRFSSSPNVQEQVEKVKALCKGCEPADLFCISYYIGNERICEYYKTESLAREAFTGSGKVGRYNPYKALYAVADRPKITRCRAFKDSAGNFFLIEIAPKFIQVGTTRPIQPLLSRL